MHRSSLLATVFVVVAAVIFAGCDDVTWLIVPADVEVDGSRLQDLPTEAELFVDETLALRFLEVVLETEESAAEVTDLSGEATWSVDAPAIAELVGATARGLAPGEAEVTAFVEGRGESSRFRLVVKERPAGQHDVGVTVSVPPGLLVNQTVTAAVVVETTADAPGATVLATLDQHVRFVGAVSSADTVSCTVEDEALSCETGSLSAGVPLEIGLQMFAFEAGEASLDVAVSAPGDTNPANDSASATLTIGAPPDGDLGLGCDLVDPPAVGLVGDAFRFRCEVANAGDAEVRGATVVVELGDDFLVDEIESGGGSCSQTPTVVGEVRCVYDLDPLATKVLEIVATAEVAAPAPVNATVFGPIVDLNAGNDSDVLEVPVNAVVALSVSPDPVVVEVGQSLQLTGTATLDDDRTVDVTHSALFSWTVDDPDVAQLTNSVSSAGEITGLLVGETDASLTYYPTSLHVTFPVTVVAAGEGDTGTQCAELPADVPDSGDSIDTAVLCLSDDTCRITGDVGTSVPLAPSQCASEHRALVFGSASSPHATVGASFSLPWASGGVNASGAQTTPALGEPASLYVQRLADGARFVVDYTVFADRLAVARVEETSGPYPDLGAASDCAAAPRTLDTAFVQGQASVYARVCWDRFRHTCELHGDVDATPEAEACSLESYAVALFTTPDGNFARAGFPAQDGWAVVSSTAGTVDGNQRTVSDVPTDVDVTLVVAHAGLGISLQVVYRFAGGGVVVQSAQRL